MPRFPFTAVVGADDLSTALVLTAISPAIGGVLVRGEKGTAKSTIVRGLVGVLPRVDVVAGCRFSCDPAEPAPDCPDGPHPIGADAAVTAERRPTRLVELPVGASDDRVTGSMDLAQALGAGRTEFHPGLLAQAHRGLLYVDEVNLLADHLVDLLLDASAMGRNTVERDGMSVTHPARFVLVGTMNPEEGELRPQLLDRFGLSVDVNASRDPDERAEVVRRRLAFDADPDAFSARHAAAETELGARIVRAQEALDGVDLSAWALRTIARVCAGFDVDGMRADIVIARAALAHAAWCERDRVTRDDIRVAARFALSHRRRRGPFDPPGLDEELLDRLLDEEPEPPTDPEGPDDPQPPSGGSDDDPNGEPGDGDDAPDNDDDAPGNDDAGPPPAGSQQPPASSDPATDSSSDSVDPQHDSPSDAEESSQEQPSSEQRTGAAAAVGTASAGMPYRPRRFEVRGVGRGEAGRRSAAETTRGRVIGVSPTTTGRVHVTATITSAASRRTAGTRGRLDIAAHDVRHARLRGRESNLVLFCVDASGSMAARKRMDEVKTAVLSLLLDAYERRDKVGLVAFNGADAHVLLAPTSSVDRAAAALTQLPHGGRTPLAEGLTLAASTLERERRRDPRRRALVVVVTDGRATSGSDALARAQRTASAWPGLGVDTVVVDCESGRFRMRLAADLAHRMGATHVPLENVSAAGLVDAVAAARAPHGKAA